MKPTLLVGCIVVVCATAFVFWGHRSRVAVREVEPGAVYGAPQLSADRLREVCKRFGVRTVVNLRGHGRGGSWYPEERAVCSELGVAHLTISFPVDDWPPRYRLNRLLQVLDEADRAILLHCLRGVDRTGWAGAVVDLAAGRPLDDAKRRLGWRRGHICRRSRCPQHRFLAAYAKHLQSSYAAHTSEVFRVWVSRQYCPPAFDADLQLLSAVPGQARPGAAIQLRVRARNRGSEAWRMSRSKSSGVRVGARILGPFEAPPADAIRRFRSRQASPVDVARSGIEDGRIGPGETRDFSIGFKAPVTPGAYLVQVDLIDEGVHWFCEMGWPGIVWTLWVSGVHTDRLGSPENTLCTEPRSET